MLLQHRLWFFPPISRIPCFETQTAAVVPGTAPSCTRATRSNTLLSSPHGTTINHHQCHPLANANGFTIDSIASSIISTSISLSLPCIAPHGIPPPSASAYACTQTHRAKLTAASPAKYSSQRLRRGLCANCLAATSSSSSALYFRFCSCQDLMLRQASQMATYATSST
ncbi:hypothetical protein CPAR01_15455 [Colletotrichum paranaense]|uniref:Uncharacterized protein n=1 Tax=Colletotrichum paranaense TaxID=1914294 RepID=A0ABQ9RZ92_9PEZI|nr:uncharacterized protein CPAR01_15455 [Colletotrichum paranaense]KAK1519962.1 hypothetical protein CPAR01_15455 [Colletotrichum paranaense]